MDKMDKDMERYGPDMVSFAGFASDSEAPRRLQALCMVLASQGLPKWCGLRILSSLSQG